MNNKKEIELRLFSIVRKFLYELEAERALQAVTLDASIERDLGIDSLGKVELFHRVEKEFSIHLPENALTETISLHDLIVLIEHAKPNITLQIHAQHYSSILKTTTFDLSSIKTLPEALLTYATTDPTRPHIYLQNEQGEEQIIHYGQLYEEAVKVAAGLHKRGIRPGETVAIMLPTSEAFFYAFCGILMIGAIPVPIYPPFRPDRIEEYIKREAKILQNAQARILITFPQAQGLSNILRTFIPSLKEVTNLKHLQIKNETLSHLTIQSNEIALIQYTSGSTGDPKGVSLTHENIFANIRAIGSAIPIKPTDVIVSWLPLYHDMGLMSWLGGLYFGIPITILSPITFLTRPERWLWAIHYHRGTLSGAPNFAYELCVKKINPDDLTGLDLSSWRFAFNGAEAISPKTIERFNKKFALYGFNAESFAPVYGLAEATVGLAFPPTRRIPIIDKIQRSSFEKENKALPAESSQEQDTLEFISCGVSIPNHVIRIVDNNDQEVGERIVGNMQFKGPSAMQGYYNNPAATQKSHHDGWWDTGDLAYLAANEIFITGRKKDLIIKAGRNLYPEEIEEVVNQISQIRKGCVIAFGVNDPNSGTEKLVVVAETYETTNKNQQQVRLAVIEQMAIALDISPDAVILVSPHTIPKTSSGKLQRSACKQAYLNGKLNQHKLPVKLQFIKLIFLGISNKISSQFMHLGKLFYTIYVTLIFSLTVPFVWLSASFLPKNSAMKITRIWARNFFRFIGCLLTIEGEINLKNKSPMIFVVNHASYIDSLVLLAILPLGTIFTAKKELLKLPFVSTFIKKFNYLTIDRIDLTKSLEDKKLIEKMVRENNSIVIFPEGTFTYATGLRPFKLGAFTIAAETETPICPIAIRGSRSILRDGSLLAKPGALKVTIGNPIYPKGTDWDEIVRIHSLARNEIAKYCGEPVIDIIVAGPSSN